MYHHRNPTKPMTTNERKSGIGSRALDRGAFAVRASRLAPSDDGMMATHAPTPRRHSCRYCSSFSQMSRSIHGNIMDDLVPAGGSPGSSMIENLPVEIMTRILESSLLPERLNLAMCSTGLLKLVTQECTELWVRIDFRPFEEWNEKLSKRLNAQNANLTDDMLSALLIRVNAQETTKSLRAWDCKRLVGSGFEPLRGSRVLECIHLATHGKEMNEPLVIDILQTMIPYKLLEVTFPPWIYLSGMGNSYYGDGGALTERRAGFYRNLRAAKHQQATEQGDLCSACSHPVSDESRQLVSNQNGMPPTNCLECHKPFCRTTTCPVTMKDCRFCGKASCDSCDKVLTCTACLDVACDDCKFIAESPCILCKGTYCTDCREVMACGVTGCKNALCNRCMFSGQPCDVSISHCQACIEFYCSDCSPVRFCDNCDLSFCSECCRTESCDVCEQHFIFCPSCYHCDVETCSFCNRSVCKSCQEQEGNSISYCDDCFQDFCKNCRDVGPCNTDECVCHICSNCGDDDGFCLLKCSDARPIKRQKQSHEG